jgi:SAM-dependent methyltransferase
VGLELMGTGTITERMLASVAAYDGNARAFKESQRGSRPLADIRRFAALADEDALVLDAGCGPASDLRALKDAGLRPVGVDISAGALDEARLLLPKYPLVRAPYDRLPFRIRVFGGLWLSGTLDHHPRSAWVETLATLMRYLDAGPVYFGCVRGQSDLAPVDEPVLGRVFRTEATEDEVAALLAPYELRDLQIELRPDPVTGRPNGRVAALGRKV